MILANARQRLSREDAQLAVRLVAQEDVRELDELQHRLVDEGFDALLDDPRLPPALLRSRYGAYASLPLFLYVIVRHALLRAGERDRAVSDYLAALLLSFGHKGRDERIGDNDDELYDTLVSLLEDVNDRDPRRAFLVRAHLGNRALWVRCTFGLTGDRSRRYRPNGYGSA